MFLERVILKNFRNYNNIDIHLKDGINILIGNNAQGKTNLLESIYFLGTTKSHRSSVDSNMLQSGSNFFKISGVVKKEAIKTKLEIFFDSNHKKLKVDNTEVKSLNEYLTNLRIIIFFPDDLNIVKEGPDLRRRYLNIQISQLNSDYIKVLNDYNKLLKTRNEYIKKMKYHEPFNKQYYDILNEYFIKKAILIYRMRNKYIIKINEYISTIYNDITGLPEFYVKYTPNVKIDDCDEEQIYNNLKKIINEGLEAEISYGKSLYGPHRDDFEFLLDKKDIRIYGSQGQQRAAILALKLSEINIIKKATGNNPILLLDDVFSEFDNIKKNNLLKYINTGIQTIITTTDLNKISKKLTKNAKVFIIKNGIIEREKGEEDGK